MWSKKIYKELLPGQIVRLREDAVYGRRLIVRVINADNNGRYSRSIVEVETADGSKIHCCRREIRLIQKPPSYVAVQRKWDGRIAKLVEDFRKSEIFKAEDLSLRVR